MAPKWFRDSIKRSASQKRVKRSAPLKLAFQPATEPLSDIPPKLKDGNPLNIPYFGLAPLSQIPVEAFVPSRDVSKAVCAFILSLAVLFNEIRDVIWASRVLDKARPSETPSATNYWGQYNAIGERLKRVSLSNVYEMIDAIHRGSKVIEDPFFQKVIANLRPRPAKAWANLVKLSQETKDTNKMVALLDVARNKLLSHYAQPEILEGYNEHYRTGKTDPFFRPVMSLGHTYFDTRFHFADGALQGRMHKEMRELKELSNDFDSLHADILASTVGIVMTFVAVRGFKLEKIT